ncbi:hypothetical protein ACFZDI_18715 [Streptomyces sp. NPDC007907]|uniref:hypothetical protein n=1 Tax=Streptomyces sp. NPDC007907 TaxID=3364789 RepID=UPI0036ED4339
MDAGLAAVLGALAGSVATIGAALATGWAQREGARIAARSEHRRERREPRHSLYRELLGAATAFEKMVGHYEFFDIEVPEDLLLRDEDIPDFLQKQVAVEKLAVEVALAGPKNVGEVALSLAKLSDELFKYAVALSAVLAERQETEQRTWQFTTQKVTSASKRYSRTLSQFVSLAQAALDDDGSLS